MTKKTEITWHEKIELGRSLLGDSIDELTAGIAARLVGAFLKHRESASRRQLMVWLGLQDGTGATRISRVLGLMRKKGLVSFDYHSRRWHGRMEAKDDGLYLLDPLEPFRKIGLFAEILPLEEIRPHKIPRIEYAIGRPLTEDEKERYIAYEQEN